MIKGYDGTTFDVFAYNNNSITSCVSLDLNNGTYEVFQLPFTSEHASKLRYLLLGNLSDVLVL